MAELAIIDEHLGCRPAPANETPRVSAGKRTKSGLGVTVGSRYFVQIVQ